VNGKIQGTAVGTAGITTAEMATKAMNERALLSATRRMLAGILLSFRMVLTLLMQQPEQKMWTTMKKTQQYGMNLKRCDDISC
jgi:hypothetical protein